LEKQGQDADIRHLQLLQPLQTLAAATNPLSKYKTPRDWFAAIAATVDEQDRILNHPIIVPTAAPSVQVLGLLALSDTELSELNVSSETRRRWMMLKSVETF
jgi:hypothetical protein